jgi:N-acetylneuraminic acid mutarotase
MKRCIFVVVVIAASSLVGCGGGPKVSFHTGPTGNQWTWVSGSDTVNQPGVYGTQGATAAANVPGGRAQSVSWIDSSGAFWIFGGSQAPTAQSDTYLNDLWKYSGGQWTWMSGSSSPNQSGIYGTLGVGSPDNVPGARNGGAAWMDKSGNLWMFGGLGLDASGRSEYLNDLWEYSAGEWIWMGGSNFGSQSGVYGTQGQASTANVPGARQPAASWVDSAGNFWVFGGGGVDANGKTDYLNDLWEYSRGQWTWISGSDVVDQQGSYGAQGVAATTNVPGSRIEAISWTDASGNLWLFGGSPGPDGQFGLFNDLWEYSGGQWTWISGSNTVDQRGSYGSMGTAAAGNVPGGRVSSASWADASGDRWLFGGDGYDSMGEVGQLNDLWRYSGGQWTWLGGANVVSQFGTYGTMGTAASGNVPGARNWAASWIDASGNLWLFGGDGYASTGTPGDLNDLWKYEP